MAGSPSASPAVRGREALERPAREDGAELPDGLGQAPRRPCRLRSRPGLASAKDSCEMAATAELEAMQLRPGRVPSPQDP